MVVMVHMVLCQDQRRGDFDARAAKGRCHAAKQQLGRPQVRVAWSVLTSIHSYTLHSYYLYSILQDTIDNVTVPAWVSSL